MIILGNQKSGTTAIAKLLALVSRKSCLLDTPLLWEPHFSQLKQGQLLLKELILKHKYFFSKAIIKEPSLTFLFDQLVTIYPSTVRYVFIVRDPRDNIRSILNRLNIPGHLDILDGEQYALTANEQSYFNAKLFEYQEEHYIGQLAERWNLAVSLYLDQPNRFQLVRYEDFQLDKKNYIHQLAISLNLEIKADITAKVDVPFQIQGDRTIRHLDFFGKRNLDRINKICANAMNQLSYLIE